MAEKMVLLKFRSNYADEFDVEGWKVMSASTWEEHKKFAEKQFEDREEVEIYFGTNEMVTFCDLDDYLRCFAVSELTDVQHQVLKDLFGEHRDSYTYEYPPGNIVTVPASDKIENGMICMLEEDNS